MSISSPLAHHPPLSPTASVTSLTASEGTSQGLQGQISDLKKQNRELKDEVEDLTVLNEMLRADELKNRTRVARGDGSGSADSATLRRQSMGNSPRMGPLKGMLSPAALSTSLGHGASELSFVEPLTLD